MDEEDELGIPNRPEIDLHVVEVRGYITVRIRYKIGKWIQDLENRKLDNPAQNGNQQETLVRLFAEDKMQQVRLPVF